MLTQKRQEKSMSQEELAKNLYVSRQTISKWEKGESLPDIEKAQKITEIFNVDLNYLISGHQEAPQNDESLKILEDRVTQLENFLQENKFIARTNGWDIIKYLIYLVGITIIGGFLTSAFYYIKH
ncbi:helix-turn-helix domain-containing protein [Vagococcus carniphilus]|uniref:helix-turn-helix domain-containing protein n=1 Tax=Vagococcus carniphilus TaxID=218144 RepID=UPI0028925CB6|nr:helix-turn-helix domain-containing protein [Vagococcus carniphilus]MDT2849205.1 helix-turn-helix domain-containing protein [Vagococcus carniphilus]